ncbi:MAG: hypothetical protein QOG19_3060 [Mycobacterium sp.]|nr:hypothetical protein [Mycobacterium sp.]
MTLTLAGRHPEAGISLDPFPPAAIHGACPTRAVTVAGAARRRPTETRTKAATERHYAGPGFFIDLGDTLAELGSPYPTAGGRRSAKTRFGGSSDRGHRRLPCAPDLSRRFGRRRGPRVRWPGVA